MKSIIPLHVFLIEDANARKVFEPFVRGHASMMARELSPRWAMGIIGSSAPLQLRRMISAVAPAIQHSSQEPSHNSAKPQEDANLSGKSPDELAAYIFEHHHCSNCHTMGAGGKLGFNERGKEVGKGFEGCISLLTSMNVIAQVKPANRTDDEKHKVERFEQFGCTTCHQIVPGKLGLTSYGQKLKSMHMACTDVERIIAK
jgi:hypothetical protein